MKSTPLDAHPWRGFDILVVSPTPTHPQDHGNRKRIYELCTELKRQGAKIHFVHYASEHDWRHSRPSRWEKEMVAAWDSYQLVPPSRALHETARGPDHLIDEWADPALSAYIRWAFLVRTYDVVLVEYTWMSFCFDAVPPGVFKICDTHDVFGGRRKLLEANGIAPEFFYTTPEEEKRGLARADLIWAIKESERHYFESVLGLKSCLTLLYAEPARGWWRQQRSRDGWLRVGVIGAKNNVNRRNLESFVATALPMFESYMAPVKLVIAGGCSEDFKHLRHPNLEILGRVPEVEDFYRDIDVICAPMQFSTGLKIKVAEALASGAPLVSHAHATEGYPVDDLLHVLQDFPSMARELVKLSFDSSALPALAQKSEPVIRKIQAQVIDTIEQTRRRIVEAGSHDIIVVAPLEALDSLGLLHDHLYATLNYLRFARRISLYLVGMPVKFDPDILRSFGFGFRVFIAPELAGELGEELPEGWTPLDLASVFQTRGIEWAYFLATDGQVANIRAGMLRKAFVRCDALELLGNRPIELIHLLRPITSVVVVSSMTNGVPLEGISAICQAPFRRKNAFASLANRTRAAGRWGGVLVLANAGDPLIGPLEALAARMRFPIAVLDVYDADAVRSLARPSNGSDYRTNVTGAHLIVDLGTCSAVSAVVVEGAQRAGIPMLRLARGASAAAFPQFRHIARPATVVSLFRSIVLALTDRGARRLLIEATQKEAANLAGNDAGWTWLWQELTRTDVQPTDQAAAEALFG